MERIQVLQRIPLFSGLPRADLESLAEMAAERRYPKDSIILYEEDPGTALYCILSGRVKVSRCSEDGKEVILDLLHPGDFFGEMALLDGLRRSATVTALEDTVLLLLERENFLRQLSRKPEMAQAIIQVLCRRLRRADDRIASLALLDVYGRVARILLQLGEEHGTRCPEGVKLRSPSQQSLADMVGASRETVSRILNDLHRKGFIRLSRGEILLRAPMASREL